MEKKIEKQKKRKVKQKFRRNGDREKVKERKIPKFEKVEKMERNIR